MFKLFALNDSDTPVLGVELSTDDELEAQAQADRLLARYAKVEVWSDMVCVYRRHAGRPPTRLPDWSPNKA